MSRALWSLGFVFVMVAIAARPDRITAAAEATIPAGRSGSVVDRVPGKGHPRIIRIAQKKPRKKATNPAPKSTEAAPSSEAAPKEKPADAEASGTGRLKFSRDIAPIFVGNCTGCHNERAMAKNGKLDLTSFETLMKGGKDGAIVVAGNPDESHLYLRLTGDETPKMPRGAGNRPLSEAAIERVGDWIKQGARLDAGIDPKAPLASYAPSAEQIRSAELAKLPADERNKLVESKGLERWKKGNAKGKPEVTPGKSFILFGILPKEKVSSTLKVLEMQYSQIRALLSPSAPAEPVMKVGIYVFNDRASFVEFVRSTESRELAATEVETSNLSDSEPYVAVIDPQGGGEAPAPKRSSRSRKKHDDGADAARSLAGVIVDALATGEVKRESEKAPLWLSLGLGSYFSSRVDPRSQNTQRLRSTAYEQFELGWNTKASEALAGEGKPEVVRSVGFAVIEGLQAMPQTRPYLTAFLRGMLRGQERLDPTLQSVFGTNREQFLEVTGQFVGTRYGRAR